MEFYHVARHCSNVCDIIFSAYDKFLTCDVTSLIYCFLDPWRSIKQAYSGYIIKHVINTNIDQVQSQLINQYIIHWERNVQQHLRQLSIPSNAFCNKTVGIFLHSLTVIVEGCRDWLLWLRSIRSCNTCTF